MLKCFLYILSLLLFICSCSDTTDNKMNGFWQLKQVIYPDGTLNDVDTVFYAFQHERLFSLTIVYSSETSCISYGYVNFPSPERIVIEMDTVGLSDGNMRNICESFLEVSGWENYKDSFDIKISSNTLQLIDKNSKKYILSKF